MPIVKCPQCGKETEYNNNEFRPFCSERCKLLDFGDWANEKFGIAGEPTEMSDDEIDEIERALEEKEI